MGSTCVGFRFRPTDQELIGHFLRLKNSVPEESTWPVPEIDLYGDAEPWAIWESFGGPNLIDQDLYFFTRLKKKGRRIVRRIGSGGTWSQGEPPKLVFATRNEKTNPIGRKTKMRLRQNNCKRKCHDVDDDDAQPLRKKAKSATVSDLQAQPEVTTNEVTETLCLNPQQQFGYVHHHEHDPTDDVVTVCEYPTDDGVTVNADWLETALLEEDENTVSHALLAEQPLSSSNSELQQPSNEAFFNIPMDDIYLNSDDFNNYIFGDEFSSGGIHTGTADVSQFSSFLGD